MTLDTVNKSSDNNMVKNVNTYINNLLKVFVYKVSFNLPYKYSGYFIGHNHIVSQRGEKN